LDQTDLGRIESTAHQRKISLILVIFNKIKRETSSTQSVNQIEAHVSLDSLESSNSKGLFEVEVVVADREAREFLVVDFILVFLYDWYRGAATFFQSQNFFSSSGSIERETL
jgi:hypothetical protein